MITHFFDYFLYASLLQTSALNNINRRTWCFKNRYEEVLDSDVRVAKLFGISN